MRSGTGELGYRQLEGVDVERCLDLWRATPGVGLSSADDPGSLGSFLRANAGLCWCAVEDERLVGTILCGTDSRRGYLYHVAVAPERQHAGIGTELVNRALAALRTRGIVKCHAMVYSENGAGRGFWAHAGWRLRDELVLFSRDLT
ncbi:MAG: GNAT family N-acetyltransferase [Spirochaetota bacterium]